MGLTVLCVAHWQVSNENTGLERDTEALDCRLCGTLAGVERDCLIYGIVTGVTVLRVAHWQV